jgi:hypothetical protein
MKLGGYHFQAKNDDYAKRGLYQSLTKNSSTFHKIPANGKYGLLEWYPAAKAAKGKDTAECDAETEGPDEVSIVAEELVNGEKSVEEAVEELAGTGGAPGTRAKPPRHAK